MNLIKYKPKDLDLFNWDRIIDRFFEDTDFSVNLPAVDLKEEENRYIMEVELPGLTEKDIELKIEGNLLTLSSNREEKRDQKKKGYILKERRLSSFQRSFTLPDSIDKDKIEASFKNGLLTINFPKKEIAKPKRIDVKNN